MYREEKEIDSAPQLTQATSDEAESFETLQAVLLYI
jgi:hypothetical protein